MLTRVRAISAECGQQLHERCDRTVDVIPGHTARCTCACHGSWGELAAMGVIVAGFGLVFGAVGWFLHGLFS